MAEEQSLNDELESFADALRSLTPRPAQRDRLMFEVMQSKTQHKLSTARASLRSWQLATGVSTLMAVTFAGLWIAKLTSQFDHPKVEEAVNVLERVEVQSVAQPPQGNEFGTGSESPTPEFATSYIRQRNRALAEGIENIPVPRVSGGGDSAFPHTKREILEFILHSQELGG